MSPREHRALRLSGVVLLLAASLWPSSRDGRRHASAVTAAARGFVTSAARPPSTDRPRPRAVREIDEAMTAVPAN